MGSTADNGWLPQPDRREAAADSLTWLCKFSDVATETAIADGVPSI